MKQLLQNNNQDDNDILSENKDEICSEYVFKVETNESSRLYGPPDVKIKCKQMMNQREYEGGMFNE